MINLLVEVINDLKMKNGGHLLYLYTDSKSYLQNVVSYAVSVTKNGDHILLVENDRNIRLINKEMENKLTRDQRAKVHFVNNFDFYYSNGDFHPQTILQYVSKKMGPYTEDGSSLYTWGLIEWREDGEMTSKVEEYEKELDKFVNENGLISVCAYDAKRTSPLLKKLLMDCHGVMMTDDKVVYLTENKTI